MNLNEDKIVA